MQPYPFSYIPGRFGRWLLLSLSICLNVSLGIMPFSRPVRAQDKDADLRYQASMGSAGLSLESAGLSPQTSLAGEPLIVIRCNVRNGGEQTATGFLSARPTGSLTEEDRRLITIPPKQLRSFEVTVRPPSPLPDTRLEVEVSLYSLIDGKASLVVVGEEPATRKVTLWRPQKNPLLAATALGRESPEPMDWRWEKPKPFDTYEFAMASRVDAELTKDCLSFESIPFPLNPIEWRNIDLVMIAEPEVFRDASTTSVLKNFINNGGRVWVMLDSIEAEDVQSLLEPDQQIRTIDQVELTDFKVQSVVGNVSEKDLRVSLDDPVVLKRLVQQGGMVTHSIDEWPVNIVMPVGRGEVILTALESIAWIQRRKASVNDDPYYQTAYELRSWAKPIIDIVHVKRATNIIAMKDLSYPIERIGNPVVPRSIVASILSVFCGALIAASLWRLTAGDAKWMGWIAPGLALLASLPLLLLGWYQKKDIPPMVSSFQVAQFASPIGGTLKETAAVYLPGNSSMELRGKGSG